MDKLLTVSELSERLGISTGTAYHWISQGRLPVVRFSKRCVRFREADVRELLEELRDFPLHEKRSGKRGGQV